MAINNKIIAGKIIQIISKEWLDRNLLFVIGEIIKVTIIYIIKIVIIIKMSMAWSWKKINCSIKGEFPFCRLRFSHVAVKFIYEF